MHLADLSSSSVSKPAAHTHVLAVDDDPSVRQLLTDYLGDYGIRVSGAASGAEMHEILASTTVDLVILDLALPGEDGLQIARDLRAWSAMPIIVVTARTEEADRVMTLELGADDYVIKPFSPRELLARIRAVLRRSRSLADAAAKVRTYRFAGWELNIRLRKLVSPIGNSLSLSIGEFNLLVAFLSAPRRVLTREQLLEMSRLRSEEVYDRSIDVQVARLRRKLLLDRTSPGLIVTERRIGYKLQADVEVGLI